MHGIKTAQSIAPTHAQSPADIAAHRAASYVRPKASAGESDPHADELLHRARNPRTGPSSTDARREIAEVA